MKNIEDAVILLTDDAMRQCGLEILDVELKQGCLRVTLDSESPLDLDRVADASTVISTLIDGAKEFESFGPFTLEVSSPGVERTLKTRGHFERFLGGKVSIKTKPNFEGPRRFTGTIKEVKENSVVLTAHDIVSEADDFEVRLNDLERAHTVFEWGSTKPSKVGAKKRAKIAKSTDKKIAKG